MEEQVKGEHDILSFCLVQSALFENKNPFKAFVSMAETLPNVCEFS